MSNLRKQVDRIDQRLLQLLRQRTKLSGEIGRTKRRHGAEIYVPERERELLARVAKLGNGTLTARAVGAIFREILSSSRAAQGQAPIGVLRPSLAAVVPAARCHFGACDRFVPVAGWPELKRELQAGRLAIGLLTLADLGQAWRSDRAVFPGGLQVIGEIRGLPEVAAPSERLFVIKAATTPMAGKRALILIECKPEADAVNSLVCAMPRVPKLVQLWPLPGRSRAGASVAAMTFSRPVTQAQLAAGAGRVGTLLGIYTLDESYGG